MSKIPREQPNIGRAEMEVLRYITDHHPVTVRQVADHVSQTKGQVRTTVLNVMERLRQKGYLARKKTNGLFHYSPRLPREELLRSLVGDFVARTLGGSLSPFVAYLTHEAKLSHEELAELRALVQTLDTQSKEGKP
jgi:predicted transcriptional regulator